jgi:hypothetical protein
MVRLSSAVPGGGKVESLAWYRIVKVVRYIMNSKSDRDKTEETKAKALTISVSVAGNYVACLVFA